MNKSRNNVKNLDLGTRKVCNQNFSKIVTLPKTFTENFLGDTMEVKMTLTGDGNLILMPIQTGAKKK